MDDFPDARSRPESEKWRQFARETPFTKMVLEMRVTRQKFKESKQQQLLDKSREILTDEKLAVLEKVTLYDRTTGLLNVRGFAKKLDYELRRAKRYKRAISLLVVSIDDLDGIRKQYGLLIVDDILRAAATVIRAAIRDVDIAARCDNNLLAILFPETYSTRALVVAERIRETLKAQPINEDLRDLIVTASIGVASFPTHARNPDDLMVKVMEFVDLAHERGGDIVHSE